MSESPLAGYRVLVTRPAHQADELVNAIESAGGRAIRFPVIRIVGRSPEIIAQELAALPSPDIAIFVSSNAVNHGLSAIAESGATIAAVGPATRRAIEATGTHVAITSDPGFNSEQLLAHPALNDVRDKTVVIVRGETGRELLGETLKKRGASVHYLSAYRSEIRQASSEEIDALDQRFRKNDIDCITVMSVETLKNLLQLLPSTSLEYLRKTPLVAPGARVIQTVMELIPGISAIMAPGPQPADMVKALLEARHSGPKA